MGWIEDFRGTVETSSWRKGLSSSTPRLQDLPQEKEIRGISGTAPGVAMAARLGAPPPDLQLRADNPAMASPSGSPRTFDAQTGVPVLTTIVLFVVVALLLVFIVWK
jgi:hypothetical protein